ncbi:hypothetical protein FPV67DRAFT_1431706, partial [Lyophyllum atratum]
SHAPVDSLPDITGTVRMFTSARAVFYAPSDLSGIGGLRHERIRATRSWHNGPRYDCVFVGNSDSDEEGFKGLHAARVLLFFSVKHEGKVYPCALVHWFSHIGDAPCELTGMWKVKPDFERRDRHHPHARRRLTVIHLDSIMRGAHLMGVAGKDFLPIHGFNFSKSLDAFRSFYVNKFVDHHAHEIAF